MSTEEYHATQMPAPPADKDIFLSTSDSIARVRKREDLLLFVNEKLKALLPFEIGISVSYPLPGTVFYEKVKADLKKKTNWTDSDEMALMFHNTFPPSYYKQLHRYVHQNYHMHLAKNSLVKLIRSPFRTNAKSLRKALSVFYHTPATFIEGLRLRRLEVQK